MSAIEIITNQLITPLKNRGYKKNHTTWFKENGEITIVFNLQKSQYSTDIWYYNYGIGFNQFFDKPITSISKCDIIYRLDKDGNETPVSTVVSVVDSWEKYFGSIDKLRIQAMEDKIPPMISARARTFLTSTITISEPQKTGKKTGDGSLS